MKPYIKLDIVKAYKEKLDDLIKDYKLDPEWPKNKDETFYDAKFSYDGIRSLEQDVNQAKEVLDDDFELEVIAINSDRVNVWLDNPIQDEPDKCRIVSIVLSKELKNKELEIDIVLDLKYIDDLRLLKQLIDILNDDIKRYRFYEISEMLEDNGELLDIYKAAKVLKGLS
jgi:hypothetical protein